MCMCGCKLACGACPARPTGEAAAACRAWAPGATLQGPLSTSLASFWRVQRACTAESNWTAPATCPGHLICEHDSRRLQHQPPTMFWRRVSAALRALSRRSSSGRAALAAPPALPPGILDGSLG